MNTGQVGGSNHDVIGLRSSQIVLIQDPKGLGTGILVSPDGWVLTNKHVAPSVGPYRVILANGRDVHGVGVHKSPHHDLAIVKIGTEPESFLDLEREVAEDYIVGTEVFAIGHPRGCRFSVARGIISNPYREVEKDYFVQTDVNINPGNSGGPLIDREGRLIGVISMMLAYSQGLGFAVPGHVAADYAREVRRLVRHGVVRIPESLLESASQRIPAVESVRSAVASLVAANKAAVEEEHPEQGFIKLKKAGALVDVTCREGTFLVSAQVAAIGTTELNNARFLAKLLELNGSRELGGASLCLQQGGVHACILRPTAGLDAIEASWAIDLVLHVALEWPAKLTALLFTDDTASSSDPGYPVVPPTPAQAPASPDDPGYPVLQIPSADAWKRS